MFGERGVDVNMKMTFGVEGDVDGSWEMSWIDKMEVDGSWTVLLFWIVVCDDAVTNAACFSSDSSEEL